MGDALERLSAGPADDSMDGIPLFQEQLGQVTPVLTGNPRNKGGFHGDVAFICGMRSRVIVCSSAKVSRYKVAARPTSSVSAAGERRRTPSARAASVAGSGLGATTTPSESDHTGSLKDPR